jgi:hypothetical protein
MTESFRFPRKFVRLVTWKRDFSREGCQERQLGNLVPLRPLRLCANYSTLDCSLVVVHDLRRFLMTNSAVIGELQGC